MRLFPDKWELRAYGHNPLTSSGRADLAQPYDSEQEARRAFSEFDRGAFVFESAFIFPPEDTGREPIRLR